MPSICFLVNALLVPREKTYSGEARLFKQRKGYYVHALTYLENPRMIGVTLEDGQTKPLGRTDKNIEMIISRLAKYKQHSVETWLEKDRLPGKKYFSPDLFNEALERPSESVVYSSMMCVPLSEFGMDSNALPLDSTNNGRKKGRNHFFMYFY